MRRFYSQILSLGLLVPRPRDFTLRFKIITIVTLSLLLVVSATRVQAEESIDPLDYMLNDAQIEELTQRTFFDEGKVRDAAVKAASITAHEGGCVGLDWIAAAHDDQVEDMAVRVMKVYSATTPDDFTDGQYPTCFTQKGLTWAILDNALDVEKLEDSDTSFVILNALRPNNISGEALAGSFFRFAVADGNDSDYLTVKELADAAYGVTGHVDGSDQIRKNQAHLQNFTDAPEPGEEGAPGVGRFFSRSAVEAMYHTDLIELSTVPRTGTTLDYDIKPHDDHKASWWSENWHDAEHAALNHNQVIGMFDKLDGPDYKPRDYLMNAARKVMELENYWQTYSFNMVLGRSILKWGYRKIISYLANSMIKDKNIDELSKDYLREAETNVLENNDSVSATVIVRAFGLVSAQRIGMLNGLAANKFLLTYLDPSEDFAQLAADSIKAAYNEVWGGVIAEFPDESLFVDPADYQEEEGEEEGDTPAANRGLEAGEQDDELNLDDDALSKFLQREKELRIDTALELVGDTGVDLAKDLFPDIWNTDLLPYHFSFDSQYQFRVFYTWARAQDDGRYYSEIRIRLYDEFGASGHLANWSGARDYGEMDGWGWHGMLAIHDVIIPIVHDGWLKNAERQEILYRSSYGGIAQGGIKSPLAWLGQQPAVNYPTNQVASAFSALGGYANRVNAITNAGTYCTAKCPVTQAKKLFESGFGMFRTGAKWLAQDLEAEAGVGYGISVTYNLTKLQKHPYYLAAVVASWALGLTAGALLSYQFIMPLVTSPPLLAATRGTLTLAAAHIGPMAGLAAADGADFALLNKLDPSLVKADYGPFLWGAIKGFKWAPVVPYLFLRGRIQINWDFNGPYPLN